MLHCKEATAVVNMYCPHVLRCCLTQELLLSGSSGRPRPLSCIIELDCHEHRQDWLWGRALHGSLWGMLTGLQ